MKEFFLQRWEYKLNWVIENPSAENIIILVHGFTWDMRGPDWLFEQLSIELQKEWFSVCRFNCIGTPPSEGHFIDMTLQSEVDDTESVISYLFEEGYNTVSILWESMGWSILACLDVSRLDNLIFWYPAFEFIDTDLKNFISLESQKILQKQWHIPCGSFKVWEKFISEIKHINLYKKLPKICNPVFLLHWDSDKDVPYEQSKKAYLLFWSTEKEIHILPWADHCFRYEWDTAIDITMNFLKGAHNKKQN